MTRLMDDITEGRALFVKLPGERISAGLGSAYTLYEVNMLTEPYVGERAFFTMSGRLLSFEKCRKVVVANVSVRIVNFKGADYNEIRPKRLAAFIAEGTI